MMIFFMSYSGFLIESTDVAKYMSNAAHNRAEGQEILMK